MNRETKLNVVWVAVLVPIILTVFGAVSATMIPEFDKMLGALALRLLLIVFFISIPLLASKLIKNKHAEVRIQSDRHLIETGICRIENYA